MGSLLVVTGPPGAGKSTVAELLADGLTPSVLVAGDDFHGFLRRGAIEPWLPAAHPQNEGVVDAAAAATGRFVAHGFETVFDGMVGGWFLPRFQRATGVAELDYVVLLPTVDVCLDRVANRLGHGFSDAPATRHMHQQFVAAEVDERHVLVDPPADPAAVAELVVTRRAEGALTVRTR